MTNHIPIEDVGEKMEITYINTIIKCYQKMARTIGDAKGTAFWHVLLCTPVEVHRHFRQK
jgi:hypothetical protein